MTERSENAEHDPRCAGYGGCWAQVTRCLACNAVVTSTEVGTVETRQKFTGFASPPISAIVHTRYGTVNRPCGCADGGLRFDAATGRSPECSTCNGDCFVDAVSERDIIHPAARGSKGEPLAPCPDCTPTSGRFEQS